MTNVTLEQIDITESKTQIFLIDAIAKDYAAFDEIADLLHQASELIDNLPENQDD